MDTYKGDGVVIANADCRRMLSCIRDNSIDLVVTSPPYDDLRIYNNSSTWNFDVFKQVADLLSRKLKDGGVIVWVVSDATVNGCETLTSFKQALYFKEIGLNIYDTMIWRKPNPAVPTEGRYYNAFEYMFVISKGIPKTMNFICDKENKTSGDAYSPVTRINPEQRKQTDKVKFIKPFSRRHNVWDIPTGVNHTKHPAIFPLQLAVDHIRTWSNTNDVVFDPFMGSGTVGVACKQLGRKFLGSEIDSEYYNIAKEQIICAY